MTHVIYCDTEAQETEEIRELENNPDFTLVGHYGLVQDIWSELEYQGFTEAQIDQFNKNRYGTCLEIVEYASMYTAYIGTR